jgi:hypothetical protein
MELKLLCVTDAGERIKVTNGWLKNERWMTSDWSDLVSGLAKSCLFSGNLWARETGAFHACSREIVSRLGACWPLIEPRPATSRTLGDSPPVSEPALGICY